MMLTYNGTARMDAVVLGIDNSMHSLSQVPDGDRKLLKAYIEAKPDILRYDSIEVFHCVSQGRPVTYILVGIDYKPILYTTFEDFLVAQHIIATAMDLEAKEISIMLDTLDVDLTSFLDGLLYRNYEFISYKSSQDPRVLKNINFVTHVPEKEFNTLCYVYSAIYNGIYMARDLINMPPNDLTPRKFYDFAVSLCKTNGIVIDGMNKWNLEKRNMGGILAVGKGSMNNPQLFTIEYNGNPDSKEKLAIVGKGVMYDSGGLSLKTRENQEFMKSDMAGAATALGVIKALTLLKYPVNVLIVAPCVENIPSATSYHVDDIIRSYSGKTIEVKNTDAEGRLILADAVAYAQDLGATKIIDLATLTGACVTALGTVRSGMIGNDQGWINRVFDTGELVHEKMWQLPSDKEYEALLKSEVADLKNTGGRDGGAITAGLFIKQFVKSTIPWVHLDIAGTAFCEKKTDTGFFGATGVGIKTILEILKGGQP